MWLGFTENTQPTVQMGKSGNKMNLKKIPPD
jgi:hypothetical protein